MRFLMLCRARVRSTICGIEGDRELQGRHWKTAELLLLTTKP